jgi:hypothetical protein
MPYTALESYDKFRLLISGASKSGKTTSLLTFIYGPYDYLDPDEHNDAVTYANEQDKHMIIISCPGEQGIRSLVKTPHITPFHPAITGDINTAAWSIQALKDFDSVTRMVVSQEPDILVLDGAHSLWGHIMNRTTNGLYLQGEDLNINTTTGNPDPYQSARWYNQAHTAFSNYLSYFYGLPTSLFIATTWEDWQAGNVESDAGKTMDIRSKRYLWPSLPGQMAKQVVGKFDARISARLEDRCLHSNCEESKRSEMHHVWQFYPKNDVQGVGVNGMKMTGSMKSKPWIHQNGVFLMEMIKDNSVDRG